LKAKSEPKPKPKPIKKKPELPKKPPQTNAEVDETVDSVLDELNNGEAMASKQ
jgi:hypothetical protein